MPSFRLCTSLRGKACLSALGNPIFCQSARPVAILFFCQASTSTTQPGGRVQNEPRDRVGSTLTGETGRQYLVESILKDNVPGRPVYLATNGNQKFVLKALEESGFQYYRKIYSSLTCPYVRLPEDSIKEPSMLVFKHLSCHLLTLAGKILSLAVRKRILKDSLRGLAALHDQRIVHTDVKADNIMIEYKEESNGVVVEKVQLTDLESAGQVPSGKNISGALLGNWMWRSPEAHAQGRVNKPSDMFSFGVVCIYAVYHWLIFAVDSKDLAERELSERVLRLQISHFADPDPFLALLDHLGSDNPWLETLASIWNEFGDCNPRKPFSRLMDTPEDFKDLVCGLMNFDPAKRLTAHEALEHPWFDKV